MRRSNLYIKTSNNVPAGEVAKNAQLLIRAGFIYKVMAGVYAYTTAGLRVIENIKQIVREEMNAVGGQELLMSSLQKKETWEHTGRWSDDVVDIWFKSKLKDDTEVGFGWSHEEPIIEMLQNYLHSYKDLPIYVYQFQNKLRNETRAKSGLMRGREFLMKDMYSCAINEEAHNKFYQETTDAYMRVFHRLGIGDDTYITFASGGAFTKFSHEFQTICEAGEDEIYLNREKHVALNAEIMSDKSLKELGVTRDELELVKTAEVGNIFNFGTQKSEEMNFKFTNKDGKDQYVHLGSYGIGISRLMGVLVEKFSDDKGIVWPEQTAPWKVYLVSIGLDESVKQADDLYEELKSKNVEVLYDDRDARPGQKFTDAELMGMPYRLTVSDRLRAENKYELTVRATGEQMLLTHDELLAKLVSL
jgi:prolyl-tRNA synthetase